MADAEDDEVEAATWSWYEAGMDVEDAVTGRQTEVPGSSMWEAAGDELLAMGDGDGEGEAGPEEWASEDVYEVRGMA